MSNSKCCFQSACRVLEWSQREFQWVESKSRIGISRFSKTQTNSRHIYNANRENMVITIFWILGHEKWEGKSWKYAYIIFRNEYKIKLWKDRDILNWHCQYKSPQDIDVHTDAVDSGVKDFIVWNVAFILVPRLP